MPMAKEDPIIVSEEIDVKELGELVFWSEEFNLHTEELKEIIRNVGPTLQAVRHHLAQKMLMNSSMTY